VLLEVVVALAVLVAALGLLGAQLAGSLNMTTYAEEQLRAGLLTDRILGLVQLDPETQRRIAESEVLEDKFGDEYPGYFWRVATEPVDPQTMDLFLIVIQVLHQTNQDRLDSIDGATVVRQIALLKAAPGQVDLVEQTGMSADVAEQLRQMVPIAGFDPQAVDLHQLVSLLDEETLKQVMTVLGPQLAQLAAGGLSSEMEGLAGQLSGLAGMGLGEGDLPSAEDLAERIREAAGGRVPGMNAGAPGVGGRRPGMGREGRPGFGPRPGGEPGGRREPAPPPPPAGGVELGRGSGPNGEYTIEDLMRLRDEYERRQGGGR
jgi:hypothetical protein